MSEGGGNDLSRIVSLIMQNPKLIEEISNLAKGSGSRGAEAVEDAEPPSEAEEMPEAVTTVAPTESVPASAPALRRDHSIARAQLLAALKPYVSRERAGAIDSMLSIAEILDAMRAR